MSLEIIKILLCILLLIHVVGLSLLLIRFLKSKFSLCVMLAISLTCISVGIEGLILGIFACYNVYSFLAVYIIKNLVTIILLLRKTDTKVNLDSGLYVVAVIFLLLVITNSFFSVERTDGWRDNSGYYFGAIHTEKTGSIYCEDLDIFFDENYEEISELTNLSSEWVVTEMKDFLLFDENEYRDYCVWTLPFYSCFLAFGYMIGGYVGLIIANSMLGAASISLIFLFLKENKNVFVASVATALLAVNPAMVWASRITLAEMYCQLMIVTAGILFYYGYNGSKQLLTISAIVIAMSTICKIDLGLSVVAVQVVTLFSLLMNKETENERYYRRILEIFYIVSLPVCYLSSPMNFKHHYELGYLKILLFAFGCLAVADFILSVCKMSKIRNIISTFYAGLQNKSISWLVSKSYFIVFVFLSISLKIDKNILCSYLRMESWYLSLIPIIVLPYGICYLIKKDLLFGRTELILWCGIVEYMLYTIKPSIVPDHMWMSRRWVTIAIPVVIVIFVVSMKSLLKSRWIQVVLSLGLMGYYIYVGRGFIVTPIDKGNMKANEELAESLDNNVSYFTDSTYLATVMKVGYGKRVYVIDNEYVDDYVKEKGKINYIGDFRFSSKINHKMINDCSTTIIELESSSTEIPTYNYEKKLLYTVYELEYAK